MIVPLKPTMALMFVAYAACIAETLPTPSHKAVVVCFGDKRDPVGCSTASYADDGHTYREAGIVFSFPRSIEIKWEFLKHNGKADVYEFTRRFPADREKRAEHKIVEFSGEKIIVFRGHGQVIVMQSPKFQEAREESYDSATIGTLVEGLADELPKMVGKSSEHLVNDHNMLLRKLSNVTEKDSIAPTLLYVWNYSTPNKSTNYVLFSGHHLYSIPGESSASVVLVSSAGRELGRWRFSTGWRIDLKSATLAYDDELKTQVIAVHTAPETGRDVTKQYFALVNDKMYFIRMEDSQGRLIRNYYLSPNHTLGGSLPARTVANWTALLESEELALRLAALTYLSGVHMNPDNPRMDVLSENMHNAKVAQEFMLATTIRARIEDYQHSRVRWLAEAAELAAAAQNERY